VLGWVPVLVKSEYIHRVLIWEGSGPAVSSCIPWDQRLGLVPAPGGCGAACSQGHGAASELLVSRDRDPLFLIAGSAVTLVAPKICRDDPGPCGL